MKVKISISINEETNKYLVDLCINKSKIIEKLLKEYIKNNELNDINKDSRNKNSTKTY
jgi:hypothetical protein